MNNSVTNNFNTYIKLPNNIGVINAIITITLNGVIVKQYKTVSLANNDRYQLLLFDGRVWKKTTTNGIDTNKFKVISVNYNFKKNNTYIIDYHFYDSNNQQIIINSYSPIVVSKSDSKNNVILIQKSSVVQDICITYNQQKQKYDDIVLHWKHSWDYDNDFIFYQIEIYKLQKTVTQRINQYNVLQFDQFNSYQLFLSQTNIQKNNQSEQIKTYDQQLFQQNSIYRYRVRALDSYGQYSNWSDYYYFKKIKSLYGKVLVRRNYLSTIYNSVEILPVIKDLAYKIKVLQRPMSQLKSEVCIEQPRNLKLSFTTIVQHRATLYSQFYSTVHVTDTKTRLNMDIIISKRFYKSLFGNVHVNVSQNTLVSKIEVFPTLIQKVWVNGVYQSIPIKQKAYVYYSFDPLKQEIDVYKWFMPTECVLRGFCTIGKRFTAPIEITVFDSNGDQKKTNNKIKLYDQNGQRIYTYDQNGCFINVYPYVQGGVNNPLTIYDYNGQQILQYYDQNGQLLTCVYTKQNVVKNWLKPDKYKVQYNRYDYLTSYLYNYSQQSNIQVLYPTKQSFVNIDANSSGQWTFIVRAIKNSVNLHLNDTVETIYINKPPIAVNLPFYVNGQYMNNSNIVNNSNPTFTFYGEENNDNDSWKYVIQISKDSVFDEIIVQNYLQYSSSVINHTIKDFLLIDEGWYYFRILTVDYNDKQQKQVAISPTVQFKYQHYVLNLYGKLQRVNRDWTMLGFMLMLRGHSSIEQQMTVFKHFLSPQLVNTLMLYKECLQLDELEQKLVIRTTNKDNDLINSILITQNHSTLKSNILIQYHYHNFPKTETYIDQNGQQHTVVIMDVPTQHYIYGKCMVYKGTTQKLTDQQPFTIHFGKLAVKKRHQSTIEEQPKYSIVVMNRFESVVQKMKCRIWNQYELPFSSEPLKQIVAVSNWVNMTRWLFGKLQLVYPQPPTVLINCNIQQMIWQSNYNAQFTFSLEQESIIPLMWYVYVIDDKPNTIPTAQNGITSYGTVNCDLRQVGSKMTGVKYLHVRSVNMKNVYSSVTSRYVIYYNNKVEKPTPLTVNGESVVGDQMPVIQYNRSMLFYWSVVVDAIDVIDHITYDLQIATDINFTNIQFEQKNISGNYFNVLAKTLPPNKYFWRVRAFDQNEYSNWSLTATIYINKAPQSPTRLSVKNYS